MRSLTLSVNTEAAAARQATGDDAWWLYATEVLDHLRLSHRLLAGGELPTDGGVLIIAGPLGIDPDAVQDWVSTGGAVLGIGDPGPIAGVAGVAVGSVVDHGHVEVPAGGEPIGEAPDVALHAIGGVRLRPTPGTDVLARWDDDGSAAITLRRQGSGLVLWFGVDVWQSIVRIQQGYPVTADGVPARDGSAPIDDDILKCEDGFALDFDRDRALPPGEPAFRYYKHVLPPETGLPMFHRPHADLWRSVLLQCLWYAADQTGTTLSWLHYWPADVPAIAHMSHDSDQNVEADARAALDAFAEADVHVTWCQVFPGGYNPETYPAITAAGHEQALHFNAMADADIATWGWPQFRAQYAWAQAVTGTESLVSNKNHYTRWEGFTDFYRWCERVGVQIDESRGPSKQGTVGFPFGTAHVSFPIADAEDGNHYHDVLNLPLHTQDLALAGHESIRDVIIDQAYQQHGVAHFLFHGVHLNRRPKTRAACLALADEVRRRGMQWWTAGKINSWERARRGIRISVEETAEGLVVSTSAERGIDDAAILIMVPEAGQLSVAEGVGRLSTVRRHGHDFVQLAVDIPSGEGRWLLTGAAD